MSKKAAYVSALSPEYALLGFMAQQPAHGYELHQRLDTELGQVWHISQSQVYNILNRLEARGYIRGALQEQQGLPARKQFHLTPAGRQRFEEWLHAPSGCSVRAIRVEFITRLYFAHAHEPQLAHQLIDAQIAEVRAGLKRLMLAAAPADQVFNRLGLELRIRQLASIEAWLSECHRAIEGRQVPRGSA